MYNFTAFSTCFFLFILFTIPAYSQENNVAVYPVYTAQVGASTSEKTAQVLLHKLRKSGYEPFILDVIGSGTLWKTVHIGKFLAKKDARKVVRDLKSSTKLNPVVFKTNSKLYNVFIARREKSGLEVSRGTRLDDAQEDVLSQDSSDQNFQDETQNDHPTSNEEQNDVVKKTITNPWYALASLGVSHVDISGGDLDQSLASKGYITSSGLGHRFGH